MNILRGPHRSFCSIMSLLVLLSMILIGCNSSAVGRVSMAATPTLVQPATINTLKDLQSILKEIRQAGPQEAQSRADTLWHSLIQTKRVPLILGSQVVFLYKGDADQVHWRGSFNGWREPGLAGLRIGQTDLWIAFIELPEASRIEYKMTLNGKDWLVDPANSNTSYSGLSGVTNTVALPGFQVTDESQKRSNIITGKLQGDLSIKSRSLGYPVNYWVYTPAGYESLDKLPVLYVLDGNDFVDVRMGALPAILDNLIASGRIEPALAVFIDEREPGNPQNNRREKEFLEHPLEHATFIADELVPAIDQVYRTDARPESRLITGVSYGGLSAAYIASSRPDVFHNLAAFSPSFWVLSNIPYLPNQEQKDGATLMQAATNTATECGSETGFSCPRLPLKIFMSNGLPDWDIGDLTGLITTLDKQGYPVEHHQVREGHTWDNWRGLSDEMLTYFFSSDE